MKINVGKCTIELSEEKTNYISTPMDNTSEASGEQRGLANIFRVTTTDELDIQYGLVSWPNAAREVCFFDWHGGDTKYGSLQKGTGRLAISSAGENEIFQIRAMKYNKVSQKANLASVSLEDLDDWAREDFAELLKKHGAIEVGTKEELIGEENKNKNVLAALIPKGNLEAVAVAFAVTRVLAIMYDYGVEE